MNALSSFLNLNYEKQRYFSFEGPIVLLILNGIKSKHDPLYFLLIIYFELSADNQFSKRLPADFFDLTIKFQ